MTTAEHLARRERALNLRAAWRRRGEWSRIVRAAGDHHACCSCPACALASAGAWSRIDVPPRDRTPLPLPGGTHAV